MAIPMAGAIAWRDASGRARSAAYGLSAGLVVVAAVAAAVTFFVPDVLRVLRS